MDSASSRSERAAGAIGTTLVGRLGRWHLPLVVLGMLVGAEGLVRWKRPITHVMPQKADDYSAAVWRRHQRAGSADGLVLILGNSAAREGIDQRALSARVGRPADNFGLSSVDMLGLADIPLEPTRDGTLLLCLNAFLLDDRTPVRYEWQLPAYVPHLVYYREAYREAARAWLGRILGDDAGLQSGPTQYFYDRPMTDDELAELSDKVSEKWSGPPRVRRDAVLEALRRLIRRGRAAGYDVIAVWLPSRPGGPSATGETALTREVRAVLEQWGIRQYTPPPDHFGADDYYDYNHLLPNGRAKLTGALVDLLQETTVASRSEP